MSKSSDSLSRREFVKGAGLAGVAAALGARTVSGGSLSDEPSNTQKAKNIIFLMVDGMSKGTLDLAHHWSLRHSGKPLNWTNLYRHPGIRRAEQDTASASSPVTDSAAAASAWGCGQRVANRAINTDISGAPLTPLYTLAKAAGKATGLVTTCRITHATPAGFVANVADRDREDVIARQYLDRDVDVLLGGGLRYVQSIVDPNVPEQMPIDLLPEFKRKGYTIVRDKAELQNALGKTRLLGLFADSHLPYMIDRKHCTEFADVPDLPSMFKAALKSLDQSEQGFVLQIEAGRVDHAGHVNDPAAILNELLEFDRCIPIALEYLRKDPETLLIVTTDHGTGGCQLNGLGDAYAESGPALDRINRATASFELLETEFRASGKFDAKRLTQATGIIPTAAQSKAIQAALEDETVKYLSSEMTRIVADPLLQTTAVGWTSNNHTAECVDVFALGPGSDQLPSFINNNELFTVMANAL